jgi:20S proteasome alpha/beta subunit
MIRPPKPPYIPLKPEPKRLPQVKAMTVAAGFVCSDGIILCADSEHSDDIAKFQRPKVFRFGDNLVLTGAGTNSSYIRMAFDKLCDEYKSDIPNGPSAARAALEKITMDVYANHIAPFFEPSDPRRPYIQLLTGTRCTSGELALAKSDDTAVYLSDGYETTGIGDYLFRYWADKFFERDLPMRVDELPVLVYAVRNHEVCSQLWRGQSAPGTAFTLTLLIAAALIGGILEAITRIIWEPFWLTRYCKPKDVLQHLDSGNLDLYERGVQSSYKWVTFYANFAWATILLLISHAQQTQKLCSSSSILLLIAIAVLLRASHLQWTYYVNYQSKVIRAKEPTNAEQRSATGNVSKIHEGSTEGQGQ